jgi:outer membrane protein
MPLTFFAPHNAARWPANRASPAPKRATSAGDRETTRIPGNQKAGRNHHLPPKFRYLNNLGIAILLLLSFATGCVDQKKEIATYRKIIDADVPTSTQPADAQPLTLLDALRLANQNNERLSIEGENYLQALIEKKRAVANFLPTVSLAPTYSVRDPASGNGNDPSGGSRDRRIDVPVTGSANLFRGFSDVATLRAAAATAEQRRALLLDLQQSILIDVSRAYFQVLRSEQTVEVLKNSIAVQEERVADIRARQRVGFAKALDTAQTEAQAAATRVTLIDARNDARRGRELLEFLTAVPIKDRPLVEPIEAPPAGQAVGSFELLGLDRRQDLQAARSAIEAARRSVEAALGEYWPSISLNVSYYLSRESAPADSEWSALLSASLPIFSAGLIEADVRDAWSRLRQSKYSESLLRRQVLQDVRLAYFDYAASGTRLDELKTQVDAAQQALAQAEDEYRAGRATNLERIVAQDQLLSAQLQHTSERYDNRVFYLALLRACGAMDDVLKDVPTTLPATQPVAWAPRPREE